jgi:TPR repeat protein
VLLAAAAEGAIDEMYLVALAYLTGEGLPPHEAPPSRPRGSHWLRRCADLGHPEGCFLLGRMYEAGEVDASGPTAGRGVSPPSSASASPGVSPRGSPPDLVRAFHCYKRAADKGVLAAMTDCAVFLERGLGTARDEEAAVRWYERASALGDAAASNNLGAMHLRGAGGLREDPARAFELFTLASHGGSVAALVNLGICLEDGAGPAEGSGGGGGGAGGGNTEAAGRLYAVASQRGSASGAYNAARLAAAAGDLTTAHAYLHQAWLLSATPDPAVAYALGNLLEHVHFGAPLDFPSATAGRRGAVTDDARAGPPAFEAAFVASGPSVSPSPISPPAPRPDSIRQLYEYAAARGHPSAQHKVALALWDAGREERALPLLQAAAERGHAPALEALAVRTRFFLS